MQIAVDNALVILKDIKRLGLEGFDTVKMVQSMERLETRKIDYVELEKNKHLSLSNNFKIQQTKVLKQISEAHECLVGDMLVPYRPPQRRAVVINSSRADNNREYTWVTQSKHGVQSLTLWSGEFGVEKIQCHGKNDQSPVLGTSDVGEKTEIEVPEQLKTIKIRVGEDMDGAFIAQIVFQGKHLNDVTKTKVFNEWGTWEQVDLKYGEVLLGFECSTFTGNGSKSFKTFKCIIGPEKEKVVAENNRD